MPPILIIGIGNLIRGDDGLGPRLIDLLNQQPLPAEIEALAVQQLTLDLVETLSQASLVIFVDARLGAPPGQIECRDIQPDSSLQVANTHFFDPHTLLAATQALYRHHPRGLIFTVTTQAFDYTQELSAPVQAALPALARQITQAIEQADRQASQAANHDN
jgi:hydrogenase maturation protease